MKQKNATIKKKWLHFKKFGVIVGIEQIKQRKQTNLTK